MARLKPVEPRTGSTFYDVANHRAPMIADFMAFYARLWKEGVVDPRVKELCRIKVASINGCHY